VTAALEGGEWSAARPGRTLPPGKTRYPFYRRLGGPQGRSGLAENLVPIGIRSRTVKPVAQSLYRLSYSAHNNNKTYNNYNNYTSNNWSHWNSNEKLKEKFGSCTGKTFDRFTTKDSYTWNITHNTESTAM